jgi:hypothetical protein
MTARFVGVGAAVAALVLSGCDKAQPPGAPSAPDNTQAAVVGEAVGSVTMHALIAGGQQPGSAGQTFSTAPCQSGGRVDLVFVRDHTPTGGEVDTSALKAVFGGCALTAEGSSVQMTGELSMSGIYRGLSEPVSLRLSGTLSTSAGSCLVDGSVVVTGQFDGTACGIPTKADPKPRSPAALAAVGTYALTQLGGSSLPRVVVTSPCIGSMNTGGLSLRADGTYEITMFGSFVCANGPGPNVSYAEPGTWAMLDNGSIVFSTISPHLFKPGTATVTGSSVSVDVDVPSSAPDIPPTRMGAVFTR